MAEAELLTGLRVDTADAMEAAGRALVEAGAGAALITGGHLDGGSVIDVLVSNAGVERLEAARIVTTNTHGTGCTLASAIATGLAQGLGLFDAVVRARDYVREAIRTAPGFGSGHGPLNHAHTVKSSKGDEA
jgi:hydroxymethylpyrimidine/phosphomethylpyrimidine kinase